MNVATVNPTHDLHPQFRDPTPDTASALVAYCDVVRTALHSAVMGNYKFANILAANGADPTIRSDAGLAPLDLVDVNWWSAEGGNGVELLERLLEGGADAFTVPLVGFSESEINKDDSGEDASQDDSSSSDDDAEELAPRSFYDRIKDIERGRAFIQAHPQYFKHPTISREIPESHADQ